jgi:nucleotide-binding universal stress UspA family protein
VIVPTIGKPHDEVGGNGGRVVVGVHGSESSRLAFEYAVDIARERGWDLEIVTAWPDADEVMIRDMPGRYIVSRGRALESQDDALASLDPDLAERTSTFLVNARPAQALIARCADADLLVVGAGRPDMERDRPGVGAECAHEAVCPLTVVPAPEPETSAPPDPQRPQLRHSRRRSRSSRRVGASTSV